MVSIIPLSIAQRRLDTGNAAQYPANSPIGGAMQGLGAELSAVAERHRQMQAQQDAFDAEIIRRKMMGQVAQAEDEVVQTAPADGSGLHDAMYGELDPRTGRTVKPGLFDEIFDEAKRTVPADERARFEAGREPMRASGSLRAAGKQMQRRRDYEQSQVTAVLDTHVSSIAQSDPDDTVTFEAARQDGLDLIARMGVDLRIKQQAVKDWFSSTAKARFEALIAKDPKRALEILRGAIGQQGRVSPSGGQTFGNNRGQNNGA